MVNILLMAGVGLSYCAVSPKCVTDETPETVF
jgi:hypothetical protein